jgi:uncharacterized protein YuzE
MRLSYDPKRNVAYFRLRASGAGVETIRLSDEVAIDIGADGAVAGIELLNANEQLRATDGDNFVLEDESIGKLTTVPLTAA